MALTRQLQNAVRGLWRRERTLSPDTNRPGQERSSVRFSLPSPFTDKPWFTLAMGVSSYHGPHGDRTRLQAHMETYIPIPHRLPSKHTGPAALTAGRRGDALLNRLPLRVRERAEQALSRMDSRKISTSIDVHSSNMPLHGGAQALASEVARRLGLVPAESHSNEPDSDEPNVQHWHGRFVQPDGGVSQLSVLHASDLPLRSGRNGQRINMAATVLSTVESGNSGS